MTAPGRLLLTRGEPVGPAGDPVAEVRRLVAASGSSFVIGMRLLPRSRREAMLAVYAFCRSVDDIADGCLPAASREAALDAWAEEIASLYEGRPVRTAVGRLLARAIPAHDLPRAEFELMVEGMRMDAATIVAPDPAVLDRYIRCVAGAAGMLSMRVFGAWRGPESACFALALARGMQLVNILRDVEEDAARGRLYLPAPLLASCGIPPDPGLAVRHPALPEARARLGRLARSQFLRAEQLGRLHRWRSILPALAMMGPYERLLRIMEADWSAAPPVRPGWRKAADGLACAARGLIGRSVGA